MQSILTNRRLIILWILLILISGISYAQNSITISNTTSVALYFTTPIDAGLPVNNVSDNSKWLNYTTSVTPPEPTVSITVEIASGFVSNGMELRVEAGTCTGSCEGDPGTPTGQVTVTYEPRVLINNIGTCTTGSGINVGHQLTYSIVITDYALIRASSPTINLLFTISQ